MGEYSKQDMIKVKPKEIPISVLKEYMLRRKAVIVMNPFATDTITRTHELNLLDDEINKWVNGEGGFMSAFCTETNGDNI